MESRNERLSNGSIPKLLLEFSIPAIMGSLVYILYNVVDRIFISKGVGKVAMSGLGITLPLFSLILAVGLLIGIGGGALISISLGRKDIKRAENILGNAMTLFVGSGIVMALLGIFNLDYILKVFGASSTNIGYAKDYMEIILLALPFQLLFIGTNHIIRGEGNPKVAMVMSVVGCGTNIILDWLFIYPLDMGIKGAAIATIIANIIVAVLQVMHFIKGKNRSLTLHMKNLKLKLRVLKGIFSIGIAPFIMQISVSVLIIFINFNLRKHGGGDDAIAVYTILNSMFTMFYMPIVGMYQGSQPIIGYNYGAKNYGRVRKTFLLTLGVASTISLIAFILAQFIPGLFIGLFVQKGDKEFYDTTVHALKTFYSLGLVIGFNTIGGSYFQSVGRAKVTTFLNVLRQFVLMIPAVFILPTFFGLNGVWMALPTSDFIVVLVTSVLVFKELKRLKVLSLNEEKEKREKEETLTSSATQGIS